MALGLPVDRNILDSRIGNLSWQTEDVFAQWGKVVAFLAGKTDAELAAAPFSYSPAEITKYRTAAVTMDTLSKIAAGAQSNAQTFPYLQSLDGLTGLQ